ncbi:MAG: CHAT domain-containing protein [Acidobacteria bacterium]|nr:CHAT domain-containing protein [Acidobacteriota bacterium]
MTSSHLDPETLAAFAEGKLARREQADVIAHLRNCIDCTADVEEASAAVAVAPSRSRLLWIALAATIAIALPTGLLIRQRMSSQPMARLVALASRGARPMEARLAAFQWTPYRGPLRAEDAVEDARRLQLAGAAGDAVAAANADPAAEAQRTAGVALLLAGEPENALTRLRTAAERAPNDAAIHSDLAAALDAAGVRLERPSLFAEALAAADGALRIEPDQPAALFNRALILEHLGLGGEARKAWDRYLAVDPSSQWAVEARERLRRLPLATGDARFRKEQSDLSRAAALVAAFPQQSRTFAEAEYLGRWGESADGAALDAARAIGVELQRASGESLLAESVRAVDAADDEQRARLAAAHALYRRARIALSRQQDAERDLRHAAAMFAGSPMALLARYFAACARFEADDVAGARRELEQLRAECGSRPYLALRAQIGWQLATVAMSDADWGGALERLDESEQLFRRLSERGNLGFIRGMQSTALACLGDPDAAWQARMEAFSLLDAEGVGDRLPVTLGGAARMELHAGRLGTARAFLRLEADSVRQLPNKALLVNALVRQTLLETQCGDRIAARLAAREALTAATALSGSARAVGVADASLAAGAANLDGEALTRAIDFYRSSQRALFLPQAYLLRARASLRGGATEAALQDLTAGLEVLERHRQKLAGPLVGSDILDAGVALGREAIRLHLARNDVAGAFRETERRNLQIATAGESPVALDELQRRLRGTATAVLSLAMLGDEAVAFSVTERSVTSARAPLDERQLASHVRGAVEGRADDASALYDALIRPSQTALSTSRQLIIVADPLLQEVPYAALYDRVAKRHLIEAMPLAMAESASSLRPERIVAPPLVVAIALPSGDLETLPDSRREMQDVTALYRETMSMPRAATFASFSGAVSRAGVVHLAGHTSRARGANELSLAFSERRATWRDIAGMHFDDGAVVILSACETLRRPEARSLSLGGSVLAAGAGSVIGTLTPIRDRDAAEFFHDVHRGLSSGLPAADALRRAQLAALASETAARPSAWRAVALLTRRISR